MIGKTIVDYDDPEDAPFFLDKNIRHKVEDDPRRRVLTRGKLALKRFKIKRPKISYEQRNMQQQVYQAMPKYQETEFKALQAAGKPCDMELHTTAVMPGMISLSKPKSNQPKLRSILAGLCRLQSESNLASWGS